MNKAIEEAAMQYADKAAPLMAYTAGMVLDGYIAGAKKVLSLPLAERLTEEERNKVKERYGFAKLRLDSDDLPIGASNTYIGWIDILESIFGADFFKEET